MSEQANFDIPSLQDLIEERRLLRELTESRGWKRLSGILERQVQSRITSIIRTPLASILEITKTEYAKGETAGLELALKLPVTMIAELDRDIEVRQQEDQDGTEHANA